MGFEGFHRGRNRPVGVDLFAGVGGLALGFEQAGFDVVAAVEQDPVHAAVHRFNFPLTSVICGDVGKIAAARVLEAARLGFIAHGGVVEDWTGEIDVVFGGPPCQGFSTIGRRDAGDDRNRLVYRFADLVGAIQPRYFVMENVPGMAVIGSSGILTRLINRFRSYGYQVAVNAQDAVQRAILRAADFGVPQDRRRLFLSGGREGERLPMYALPTVTPAAKRRDRGGTTAPRLFDELPLGPTVWDAIGDLPDLDSFEQLRTSDEVRLTKREFERMAVAASPYVRILRCVTNDPEDFGYPRVWDPRILTSSLRTEHTTRSVARFRRTQEGNTEPVSRFYRLDRSGLCNTLRAGTGRDFGAYTSARPLHPILPRVISLRAAARLHSFPDWFRVHRTKWHGFRSIGNAVPPFLSRAIAKAIREAIGGKVAAPDHQVMLGAPGLLRIKPKDAVQLFALNGTTLGPGVRTEE